MFLQETLYNFFIKRKKKYRILNKNNKNGRIRKK